jgi:nitroreductase
MRVLTGEADALRREPMELWRGVHRSLRVEPFSDLTLPAEERRWDEPVARPLVEHLVANATRIPSAGYSQGFAFVVLTDRGQRRLFWETTSGPDWRSESESVSLTRAPVLIVPLAHKQAYLDRYALPDKAHTPVKDASILTL